MNAQQLLADGKLNDSLVALQNQVRAEPGNVKHRIFLFQLLCVLGQWKRALNQLNVAGELDAAALPMVQTYREAIQCEALRAEIFRGRRAPLIFGRPQPWMAQLVEALATDGVDPARALAMREAAMSDAPASSGSIDGAPFSWLADADPRLGPTIEAIINGRYFWVPVFRIARIELDPPSDLRDTVWTAATFTWTNGASTVGLIPSRYEGSVDSGDEALMLSRRTDWTGEGLAASGLGQRLLATDSADYALMDVRVIEFEFDADVDADADTDSATQADADIDRGNGGLTGAGNAGPAG